MSARLRERRYEMGLAGLGMELAASVIGLTLLGLWLDRRWETEPWALVVCATIGFVGGMYNFIRSARKAARRAERRAREERRRRGREE